MKLIIDFLVNALPWIGIGLFIAFFFVRENARENGKTMSRLFDAITWSPAACFVFVGLMEFHSGNKNSGVTWLILAVFHLVLNYANMANRQKKE